MTDRRKTKRELLDEYLTRPEVPEEVKQAWKELDRHVATLVTEASTAVLKGEGR